MAKNEDAPMAEDRPPQIIWSEATIQVPKTVKRAALTLNVEQVARAVEEHIRRKFGLDPRVKVEVSLSMDSYGECQGADVEVTDDR